MNRTLQGRVVNEFRVAGIRTVVAANRYLRDVYIPQHNATFRRAPRDAATAFAPLGRVDLNAILCQEDARIVAPDNTVLVAGRLLQIERQRGRRTCAGLEVLVRQHLDGAVTVIRPPNQRLAFSVIPSRAPAPAVPARRHGHGRWPKDLVDQVGTFL